MIDWAVIPIAGHGSRLMPAAAAVDKALLPVGLRPMLHWTLLEACDAGMRGLVIVARPDQSGPRAYLEAAREAARGAAGGDLAALGRRLAQREVHWVEQTDASGIADAFLRCRPLTADDPFVVLLPDNWFIDGEAAAGQIVESYRGTGLCTLGLTRVGVEERRLYGNVGGVTLERLGGATYRILSLQDKLPGAYSGIGDPALRATGRYAVDRRFYEALVEIGPPPTGEWDDVPAWQALIEEPGVAGHRISAVHYDVGNPDGLLAAAAYLHRRREERGDSAGVAPRDD